MSEQENQGTTQEQPAEQPQEQTQESGKGAGYHVSDLPEGAKPDPLGDSSLSARERATATNDD